MKKLYEETAVQDIANAIREKNGTATKYKSRRWALLCEHSPEAKQLSGISARRRYGIILPT